VEFKIMYCSYDFGRFTQDSLIAETCSEIFYSLREIDPLGFEREIREKHINCLISKS
jgi:hypothetical protein